MRAPPEVAALPVAYLTTTGRRSGQSRRIEIWFGMDARGRVFFLSSGGRRSHWVRNLEAEPAVIVELGATAYAGWATVLDARPEHASDDDLARRLLAAKYQGWSEGVAMSDWARHSLAVVVDVEPGPSTGD